MNRFLALTLLAAVLPPESRAAEKLADRLAHWKITSRLLSELEVESSEKSEAGLLGSEEVVAVSADKRRRARVVVSGGSQEAAVRNLLRGRRSDFLSNYNPRNLGTGKVLRSACRPGATDIGDGSLYDVLADKSFRFGTCAKDREAYRAAVAFLKCPGKAVEIYYFYPLSESERPVLRALGGISCNE